jgi:hypothetical protein
MDRSYLSHAEVIAASRPFICVRLATYEDLAEGNMLKALVPTRSGELENSVFALLGPDSREKLVRPGRSMRQVYGTAQQMAEGLRKIAERYASRELPRTLPLVTNVRLALDVAAADNRPLVILRGSLTDTQQTIRQHLAALAWQPEFLGQFIYVHTETDQSLEMIGNFPRSAGMLIVKPSEFGVAGEVLVQLGGNSSQDATADALRQALERFSPAPKQFSSHVRSGKQQGMFWKTQIPVTDPQEKAARERGRK